MLGIKLLMLKQRFIDFIEEEDGIGTVEMILILVEKPNAKHRYVLCGK